MILRFIRAAAQAIAVLTAVLASALVNHARADADFDRFLHSLIPQAQSLGVTRETFEAATRGLTPDLNLPDLVVPGRLAKPPGQPEFVLTPGEYLKERQLAGLAAHGRKLAAQHRATLARIDREIGVPAGIVLAIWGRETDFGRYRLPHDAIRALATQAWLGRRKEIFREEFLLALKMLQEGHVKRADMRSSWAGALGLTQFLPSDFYKYAVDFDGDGKRNIWTSVPDALASAARQLAGKGWQRDGAWAIEVKVAKDFDCATAEPSVKRTAGEWLKLGFTPAGGQKLSARQLAEEASVLMPEGTHGPAFLTPKNYFVIKDYNFSDLYVLFVGNLADRIAGGRGFVTPWAKDKQLRTADVEAMQRRLTALGFYQDKVDGKAGMLTRSALGAYQKANRLALDCWPTAEVLRHMQGRAGRR
jgi:lytic murein transglycosylase